MVAWCGLVWYGAVWCGAVCYAVLQRAVLCCAVHKALAEPRWLRAWLLACRRRSVA